MGEQIREGEGDGGVGGHLESANGDCHSEHNYRRQEAHEPHMIPHAWHRRQQCSERTASWGASGRWGAAVPGGADASHGHEVSIRWCRTDAVIDERTVVVVAEHAVPAGIAVV